MMMMMIIQEKKNGMDSYYNFTILQKKMFT